MADQKQLTKDQADRIAATLRRIREGLKSDVASPFEEPAHIFKPEAADDRN